MPLRRSVTRRGIPSSGEPSPPSDRAPGHSARRQPQAGGGARRAAFRIGRTGPRARSTPRGRGARRREPFGFGGCPSGLRVRRERGAARRERRPGRPPARGLGRRPGRGRPRRPAHRQVPTRPTAPVEARISAAGTVPPPRPRAAEGAAGHCRAPARMARRLERRAAPLPAGAAELGRRDGAELPAKARWAAGPLLHRRKPPRSPRTAIEGIAPSAVEPARRGGRQSVGPMAASQPDAHPRIVRARLPSNRSPRRPTGGRRPLPSRPFDGSPGFLRRAPAAAGWPTAGRLGQTPRDRPCHPGPSDRAPLPAPPVRPGRARRRLTQPAAPRGTPSPAASPRPPLSRRLVRRLGCSPGIRPVRCDSDCRSNGSGRPCALGRSAAMPVRLCGRGGSRVAAFRLRSDRGSVGRTGSRVSRGRACRRRRCRFRAPCRALTGAARLPTDAHPHPRRLPAPRAQGGGGGGGGPPLDRAGRASGPSVEPYGRPLAVRLDVFPVRFSRIGVPLSVNPQI